MPDLSKTNYTKNEIKNNYSIETFKLEEAIEQIKIIYQIIKKIKLFPHI